jgi:uncharacterized FAD-dependent dehydrogenase
MEKAFGNSVAIAIKRSGQDVGCRIEVRQVRISGLSPCSDVGAEPYILVHRGKSANRRHRISPFRYISIKQ